MLDHLSEVFHLYVYVYVHLCMYVYIYVYLHLCMYVYIGIAQTGLMGLGLGV